MVVKTLLLLALSLSAAVDEAAAALPNQARHLPPVGIEIPAAAREALEKKLHDLEAAAAAGG